MNSAVTQLNGAIPVTNKLLSWRFQTVRLKTLLEKIDVIPPDMMILRARGTKINEW